MNDKTYDIINKIQRWLVAIGVAYLGVSAIWGLPYGDQINQTIVVLSTLLATILEISTTKWQKDHAVSILDFNELIDETEADTKEN